VTFFGRAEVARHPGRAPGPIRTLAPPARRGRAALRCRLIPSVAPAIGPSLLPTLAPRLGSDRLESLRAPRPEAFATLADELVSALAAAGITTYFGVPGGAIEPFFNALARGRAEGWLQVVPMRGEDAIVRANDDVAVFLGHRHLAESRVRISNATQSSG
jgi:hypothetical protein